eukprot:CAMPEP_0183353514 /NCGR_PEP_ID=MMETSP0164_2-20130417/33345_1 /TAXON_ID=221442 /ORGANISM="Coccolithus pelagicus ssp braarudi, Strain PLY182g" /LENGTH=157 /DNA_ID=CAMNT_0025526189 /DNA_START=360 /DNA_END=830 /DNA_ORIENTATION=+
MHMRIQHVLAVLKNVICPGARHLAAPTVPPTGDVAALRQQRAEQGMDAAPPHRVYCSLYSRLELLPPRQPSQGEQRRKRQAVEVLAVSVDTREAELRQKRRSRDGADEGVRVDAAKPLAGAGLHHAARAAAFQHHSGGTHLPPRLAPRAAAAARVLA